MKIEMYSKDDCHYCQLTKKLLDLKSIPYSEFKIDKDLTISEVKEQFPDAKTVPIILIDGVWIGGYVDLTNYFSEKGI